MTLDDRRLSRCIHLVALGIAVAALKMFLPSMARIMGDDLTVGSSLAVAAVFAGLPAMIGLPAWSDRSARRTPLMSAFLILCGLLAACLITLSVTHAGYGVGPRVLAGSFGALGASIALAVAAAFVRDRRHDAVAA